jgi:large conductance mechanosensitive channel
VIEEVNNMWKEFKQFAVKGNVVDLAVGVIIGSAFGSIVSSLVDDIVMPFFGLIIGGIDFTNLKIQVGDATIQYGSFLQAIVNFLIIGFTVFLFVKLLNNRRKREEEMKQEEDVAPSKEVELLSEIRDLLKPKQIDQ